MAAATGTYYVQFYVPYFCWLMLCINFSGELDGAAKTIGPIAIQDSVEVSCASHLCTGQCCISVI